MNTSNLIFFALLAGVFWFLVLRPQQQRQKQHRDMLQKLAPGDEIVTIGGIYATVLEVGERVRVAVADGSELELAKQAVAQVLPPAEAEEDADLEEDAEVAEETAALETADDAAVSPEEKTAPDTSDADA